jgi:hypothetical protein
VHRLSGIDIQDVPPFEDLLRSVGEADAGYLMLTSLGGDANVAEKLIMMCRQRFRFDFGVIIPNYAKSAGTMIALGSDKILMGYLAELGPIDPQLVLLGGEVIPARSFIDGLEMIRERVEKKGEPIQTYIPILSRIRPEILAVCQRAIADAQAFAAKWLKQGMLRHDPKQAETVAELLSSGEAYKSHGKVIDFKEARDTLHLRAEKIDEKSDLWGLVWELYCRSLHHLQQSPNSAKLFESESVSVSMSVHLLRQPQGVPQPRQIPVPHVPPLQPTAPQPAPSPTPPRT